MQKGAGERDGRWQRATRGKEDDMFQELAHTYLIKRGLLWDFGVDVS